VHARELPHGRWEVTSELKSDASSGADGSEPLAGIAMGRRRSIVTSYSPDLIRKTLEVVGAEGLVDEIARDEDRGYTHAYLSLDVPAYVSPQEVAQGRILDFGCGGGASTLVLHRLFPEAEVVGVELDETYISLAEPRRQFYGIDNVRFHQSPGPDRLPPDIGTFDLIVLSAVFEHVLPEERDPVLDMLWSVLRPGGVMVVDQTPHRWFPQESHTTALPLLNYLPKQLALRAAHLSPRIVTEASWEQLLRWGMRGATTRELVRRLRRLGYGVEHLKPTAPGIRDEVELWYRGPSFEGYGPIKPAWNVVARAIQRAFGVAFVPYLSVGLRKTSG
jgi:2-polyprenyl-3-methyl-5-hydroxy-6-metoxy-1,4-benzoquinol methylase